MVGVLIAENIHPACMCEGGGHGGERGGSAFCYTYIYILLDVIGGGSSALWEGCPRTMTGVSQHWFSGHFRQVFSTPMHYRSPRPHEYSILSDSKFSGPSRILDTSVNGLAGFREFLILSVLSSDLICSLGSMDLRGCCSSSFISSMLFTFCLGL
jgi:hypothetical protein